MASFDELQNRNMSPLKANSFLAFQEIHRILWNR